MKIFVHIDADPDYSRDLLCKKTLQSRDTDYEEWKGLVASIDFLTKFRESVKNVGLDFKATFFLRADEQTRAHYGEFTEIFSEFYDSVRESFAVGWHPHLFRWSDSSKCWQQEWRDHEWTRSTLTDCYDTLRARGYQVEYSKMGWCFHNNITMKSLSDLGIKADFSALPGAKAPGRTVDGASFQDRYDWGKTKPFPYHPSEQNYQVAGSLKILEVPLTTYEVSGLKELLYTVKLATTSFRKMDFSYLPSFSRYVPLFLPNLSQVQDLSSFCKYLTQSNKDYITIYTHPDNLLNSSTQTLFESFAFQMLSASNKYGTHLSYSDAPEVFNLCSSKIGT